MLQTKLAILVKEANNLVWTNTPISVIIPLAISVKSTEEWQKMLEECNNQIARLESQVRKLGLLNEDLMARLDREPSNTKADDEDVAEEKIKNSKGGKTMPLTEKAIAATSL
uniref:Predicted protein n=1 Tax=Physcomitrium patens TaxID=3218 RepID=A9U4S5_PHYPA